MPAGAEALAKLKASAAKYLQSGFEAAQKESPLSEAARDRRAVSGSVAVERRQLCRGDRAAGGREDRGRSRSIAKGHPAASKPQYAIEAYKAALRAYVSVSPPQEKKAVSTMQSLEKIVQANGDSGQTSEQLTRIYIGMGVALAKADGRTAGGRQTAGSEPRGRRVREVLGSHSRTARRAELAHARVARPNLLRDGHRPSTTQRAGPSPAPANPPNKTARDYLTKARDAYQQLLAEAAKDPKLAPSDNSVLAAKLQLGECYRALGQYQQALDTFSEILKEKEASLAVQRAAALAYQERGQREDPQWFEFAIHGGYKLKSTGQNRIWGWLRISQVAGRAAQSDTELSRCVLRGAAEHLASADTLRP